MSIFLSMSRAIDHELLAGSINVDIAKQQLKKIASIAEGLELTDFLQYKLNNFSYTSGDAERDKAFDENFCHW